MQWRCANHYTTRASYISKIYLLVGVHIFCHELSTRVCRDQFGKQTYIKKGEMSGKDYPDLQTKSPFGWIPTPYIFAHVTLAMEFV